METPGPVVMDFRVAKETNVYPMIPSGQTIAEMVVYKPENGDEPASTCHYVPGGQPRDTRFPTEDEVVDVAR
jgi:hypothetical protein